MITVLASAVLAAQAAPAGDPRGADAVALFDDMCVRTLIGLKSVTDGRFTAMKVDEKDARQTLPEFDPDKAWAVVSTQSAVRTFLGFKDGVCSTEVMAADRSAIEAQFAADVARTAADLKTTAKLEQRNDKPVNGKPASFQAWRLKTANGDILLALTATSEGAAEIQHLMTASFIK